MFNNTENNIKNDLTATINSAIETKTPIAFTLESGTNATIQTFVPSDLDVGIDDILIYAYNGDLFVVDTTSVIVEDNEFVCQNGTSTVIISANSVA